MAHAFKNTADAELIDGGEDYAVKRGNIFVNEYGRKEAGTGRLTQGTAEDANHLLGCFPTLFPYGEGGFETDRPVNVSYEGHARWALAYHDRRYCCLERWLRNSQFIDSEPTTSSLFWSLASFRSVRCADQQPCRLRVGHLTVREQQLLFSSPKTLQKLLKKRQRAFPSQILPLPRYAATSEHCARAWMGPTNPGFQYVLRSGALSSWLMRQLCGSRSTQQIPKTLLPNSSQASISTWMISVKPRDQITHSELQTFPKTRTLQPNSSILSSTLC
ncbi:hypothetical protein CPB83DRAFT_605549 [Crepidotus variabilis]|uniref:Uncharacterized protein n=1 Tax=Crepidotus variabilis TaxID=179855 RepID=A0A9P6E8R9_9AGAR|nr:hypothetical protein CPB83DRAFT_605549 [Crepidotus variabilis]